METHEAIFAEIEQMREGAAALLRAKLDAMAGQIRDQANRVAGDLDVVVPPDLEALLPIASLAERLRSLAAPPPPPPPPVLALDLDILRALDAGRALRVLERRGAGPDHPVSAFCREAEHLKAWLCAVN